MKTASRLTLELNFWCWDVHTHSGNLKSGITQDMNATLPCASVAPWEAVNVSLCGRKTSAFGGIGSPLSLPQQIVDVLICSDKTVSNTFWS